MGDTTKSHSNYFAYLLNFWKPSEFLLYLAFFILYDWGNIDTKLQTGRSAKCRVLVFNI